MKGKDASSRDASKIVSIIFGMAISILKAIACLNGCAFSV